MKETAQRISQLLSARRIAIVGASDDPTKPGFRPLQYLRSFGYAGDVYAVNPRISSCQGVRCYPNLSALPATPDLVGVIVAAGIVPSVLAEAGRIGVSAAVVMSAGFAELGLKGNRLQAEVAKVARLYDMVLCGPNSVGIIHAPSRLALTFTEALTRGELTRGNIALVSQSGAFGTVLYAKARERSIGINTYVSSGNEVSLGFGAYVEALIEDPEIETVGGYLEGLRDVAELTRAATRAKELGKKIVVLKVGQSEPAGRAAASHTGSLVGDANAYRAAFKNLGIVQVEDEQELLDALDGLQTSRLSPGGGRVAIVSTSGGAGVLLTDLLAQEGLEVADLSSETSKQLSNLLPEFASPHNPIDVTGRFVTNPRGLGDILAVALADSNVDVLIVFVGLAWSFPIEWSKSLSQAVNTGGALIVIAPLLDEQLRADLRNNGIIAVRTTRQAVRLCAALKFEPKNVKAVPLMTPDLREASEFLDAEVEGGVLDETLTRRLISSIGLMVPRSSIESTPEDAEAAARKLGGQVVLKAYAAGLIHKSDVGGVLVDLSPEQVQSAFLRIHANLRESAPEVRVLGIRVEEMFHSGIEMFIGAVRTPPFGMLVAVGAGGTGVELSRDVAYGLAPLSKEDASEMIDSLSIAPLLRGYRGREPADMDALASSLVQVSKLVDGLSDRLAALDLNPILVLGAGRGVVVLDAVAVVERERPGKSSPGSVESER